MASLWLVVAALIAVAPALVASSSCSAPGWEAHDSFDPACVIGDKKKTTTKTCGDCLRQAVTANHSVYAWNHASHHCYTSSCTTFGGVSNPRVQSGCRAALPGCKDPTPEPPPPSPSPAPWSPPGPAVFILIEPGGSSLVGRACPECAAGAVMDDPKLELKDGFLSYDEMPPHHVTMRPFSIMSETVSAADFTKSGLPGSVADASHETATAYAAWLSAQPGQYSYRLPTEAEWEVARRCALVGHGVVCSSASAHALQFGPREHVFDWHGVYPNPPDPSGSVTAGPASGILKVVRDGSSAAKITTRYSVAPGATAKSSALASNTRQGSSPLPQVGIVPGIATSTTGEIVDVASLGPDVQKPLFNVRMVLPIPPDSEMEGTASLTGLDPATMWHNHSPGFEVLPNGDVLAVWFSSSTGHGGEPGVEGSINSRMVQARLRHGADRWDPPALFYDWKYMNDQSGLLWREGSRTFFWGGGGGQLQFKVAVSDDSGATWKLHLPHLLNKIGPTELASQPITTAFRGKNGELFMGVDSKGASSGLFKSMDNGTSWADTHGRTVGRHTTFFTAAGRQTIMAFGGKNSDIDGYMPYTFSTDGGASFAKGAKLPCVYTHGFPALGGNQRPCVHRLLSGNLVFVGDLQVKGSGKQPQGFTPKVGETSGVYAALSTDDGKTWKIKPLPIALPHESDLKNFGTLGYSTENKRAAAHRACFPVLLGASDHPVASLASALNGDVDHLHPCLHYQINEAWFHTTDENHREPSSGSTNRGEAVTARSVHAKTANGGDASWSYIVDPIMGYLLDGAFVATFPNSSSIEYIATYSQGRRTSEAMHDAEGRPLWRWNHTMGAANRSVLQKYDTSGALRVRSEFENQITARDYNLIKSNPQGFRFIGLTADGPACIYHANGSVLAANTFKAGVVAGHATCASDERLLTTDRARADLGRE